MSDILSISTEKIHASPYQTRRYFDAVKLQDLAENIKQFGLIHPVCVREKADHYELLVGERRLRAVRLLNAATIRAEIKHVTDDVARGIVVSENLQRENLTPIEEIEATANWIDYELSKDAEYQVLTLPTGFEFKHPSLPQGLKKLAFLLMKLENERRTSTNGLSNKFIGKVESAFSSLPFSLTWQSFYVNDFQAYASMPEAVKEVAITQKLNKSQAKAMVDLQRESPDEFQQIRETGKMRVNSDASGFKTETIDLQEVSGREIAQRAKQIKVEKQALARTQVEIAVMQQANFTRLEDITTTYRVIYADPPWSYGNDFTKAMPGSTRPEDHYPTMLLADICALPVKQIAQDNAVLFLWTTSPLLDVTFQVISAWGFTYKTSFVWDKIQHNFGHYNSVRHEFLLVCTRGSCTPDNLKLHDSVVSIERTEHSRKPERFREIIDELYPHGQRIELFARRPVTGWDTWGNQA